MYNVLFVYSISPFVLLKDIQYRDFIYSTICFSLLHGKDLLTR